MKVMGGYVVEILAAGNIALLTWLHLGQNSLESELSGCVRRDSFEEVKEELKNAVALLTEVRVENARWQEIVRRAINNN